MGHVVIRGVLMLVSELVLMLVLVLVLWEGCLMWV
jgi:hypothetical protein